MENDDWKTISKTVRRNDDAQRNIDDLKDKAHKIFVGFIF